MLQQCKECNGTNLSWKLQAYCPSEVMDGRLRLNEIQVIAVLGCDECSATNTVISAEKFIAEFVAIERRLIALDDFISHIAI